MSFGRLEVSGSKLTSNVPSSTLFKADALPPVGTSEEIYKLHAFEDYSENIISKKSYRHMRIDKYKNAFRRLKNIPKPDYVEPAAVKYSPLIRRIDLKEMKAFNLQMKKICEFRQVKNVDMLNNFRHMYCHCPLLSTEEISNRLNIETESAASIHSEELIANNEVKQKLSQKNKELPYG